MASYTITQKALALLAAEEQQKRIQEQQRAALLAAETSAKAEAERNERIRLETERELTRAAVERSLIEKAAAEAQAAEALALQAELARLRNRGETQILRDEMSQMRAEIAQLKACPTPLLTPAVLEPSRDELATARSEIAELKALVRGLCVLAGSSGRDGMPGVHGGAWLMSLTQPCRDLWHQDFNASIMIERNKNS